MQTLFKNKGTKLGSLISLIAVTAMLALFSLALPEFLASVAGRLFVGVWAAMAILAFIAHARRMAVQSRNYRTDRLRNEFGHRVERNSERRIVRLMRG